MYGKYSRDDSILRRYPEGCSVSVDLAPLPLVASFPKAPLMALVERDCNITITTNQLKSVYGPNVERRKLFDPGDPFDAMAESFRRQTIDLALGALRGATCRDMDGHSQIKCLIAGVLTGLVGAMPAWRGSIPKIAMP